MIRIIKVVSRSWKKVHIGQEYFGHLLPRSYACETVGSSTRSQICRISSTNNAGCASSLQQWVWSQKSHHLQRTGKHPISRWFLYNVLRHWVCKHGREGKVHHDFEVRHWVVEHIKPHELMNSEVVKMRNKLNHLQNVCVSGMLNIVKSSNHL